MKPLRSPLTIDPHRSAGIQLCPVSTRNTICTEFTQIHIYGRSCLQHVACDSAKSVSECMSAATMIKVGCDFRSQRHQGANDYRLRSKTQTGANSISRLGIDSKEIASGRRSYTRSSVLTVTVLPGLDTVLHIGKCRRSPSDHVGIRLVFFFFFHARASYPPIKTLDSHRCGVPLTSAVPK